MPTPLLEPSCRRNSKRKTKSAYSRVVKRLPPALGGTDQDPVIRQIPLTHFFHRQPTLQRLAVKKGDEAGLRGR